MSATTKNNSPGTYVGLWHFADSMATLTRSAVEGEPDIVVGKLDQALCNMLATDFAA